MFLINRSFLLQSVIYKIMSWSLTLISFISITSFIIYDIAVIKNNDIKGYIHIAEGVAGLLIIRIAVATRYTTVFFDEVKELDEKFGFFEDQEISIRNNITSAVFFSLISLAIDGITLLILRFPTRFVILVTVAFCVQDTELAFYAMIADNFNTRLNKLIDKDPVIGSQVYRQLLAATFSFSKPFHSQIVTIVSIIKYTSIVYAVIAFIAKGAMVELLRFYFVWREIKTLYSLWLMCYAAGGTNKICEKLLFCLTEKLVLLDMDKDAQWLTKRWYRSVQSIQPSLTEAVPIVKLNLPLKICDWTFQYLIMSVQIYLSTIDPTKKNST
ncbi:uncharacterized protein LOC123699696 isoform X1 [Colias croceus]|uniref:uncharacterized protein LOC123699696 isoform X1 n=1 Tax=Colias crocea TaxID=72248 RepID=UPI001E27F452|nr:uncharacterized protein LOC123699696 isoform X1 [Colias croceus]